MMKLTKKLLLKIQADSFYGPLFKKTKSMQALVEAGFFDDGLDPEVVEQLRNDTHFLTTPLHKITTNLQGKPTGGIYTILVTTGAFAPLHKGHIAMMEQAKYELEKRGEVVVGGLVAPGHDSYVSVKRDGTAAMDASLRVEVARRSLDEGDWLMVDPWPALYTPKELNFTTILERTEKYLSRHLPNYTFQIRYVYGQDNQGFGDAFLEKSSAVCVGRGNATPGVTTPHVVFAPHQSEYTHASSTKLRQGEVELLHSNARSVFEKSTLERSGSYGIRNDLAWATQDWDIRERDVFHADFLYALRKLLYNVYQGEMQIEILDLATQQAYLNEILQTGPVINLDICLEGGERLDVSRLFAIADLQSSSIKMVNRPYSASVDDQIARLSGKKYLYFDDDIVSGKTLQRVSALLRERGIAIVGNASSLQASGYGVSGKSLYDIDDARDFLLGSRSSGLTAMLPDGTMCRVPYMAPYVSLSTRASIPPDSTHVLSLELWALNAKLLQKHASHICVKDADKASKDFLRYIGFSDDIPLYKVAERHVKLFQRKT